MSGVEVTDHTATAGLATAIVAGLARDLRERRITVGILTPGRPPDRTTPEGRVIVAAGA
jgi:hypothetical protein